jgi:hypothetical protein
MGNACPRNKRTDQALVWTIPIGVCSSTKINRYSAVLASVSFDACDFKNAAVKFFVPPKRPSLIAPCL